MRKPKKEVEKCDSCGTTKNLKQVTKRIDCGDFGYNEYPVMICGKCYAKAKMWQTLYIASIIVVIGFVIWISIKLCGG